MEMTWIICWGMCVALALLNLYTRNNESASAYIAASIVISAMAYMLGEIK